MSRAPRSSSARRSWGTDDSHTPILHVDMDAFFVAVELLDHPELRGRPVAVGGETRGVVSAASYEARAFGVNSAMPVAQARLLCPHIVMIPGHHSRYSEVSKRVMQILRDVTPRVEQLSVDEAFLDVSGARRLLGSPVEIARGVRARIRAEEGLPASIGIAATKHVAKIASAHAKPDGLLLIPEPQTRAFLAGLPVGALWGVGDKTQARLERAGVRTVADLLEMGESRLERAVGTAAARHLTGLAKGRDSRAVQTEREEKSISREHTFFDHVADGPELRSTLLAQCHDVARRLRTARLVGKTVSIKVRFADFTTVTRSVTLPQPTNLGADIYAAAAHLLDAVHVPEEGLRLLGVRMGNVSDPAAGVQLTLDGDERQERAEATLDQLRAKFGAGAAGPASVVLRGQRNPQAPHGD